jgi:hypothetical protein
VVVFAVIDVVPHIAASEAHQQSPEFSVIGEKGLFQHNRHKADQPIELVDVRFRGTSELGLSTCDAARPSVAVAPFSSGGHRHRTVLADAAPRLLGGMGLRRGPRRATDRRVLSGPRTKLVADRVVPSKLKWPARIRLRQCWWQIISSSRF